MLLFFNGQDIHQEFDLGLEAIVLCVGLSSFFVLCVFDSQFCLVLLFFINLGLFVCVRSDHVKVETQKSECLHLYKRILFIVQVTGLQMLGPEIDWSPTCKIKRIEK